MIAEHKRAEYFKAYNKRAVKRISLCLSLEKDKDVIEAIEKEGKGNLQNGIRLLIREALKKRENDIK